jgi:seryl-tRNA synthetase
MDLIAANPDVVKRAIEAKGIDLNLGELLSAHEESKKLILEVEALRHERNILSKQIPAIPASERPQTIAESKQIGEKLKKLEPVLREQQERVDRLLLLVPNIPGPDEPVGPDEASNVEVRRWGEPPAFAFAPRDHLELLDLHNWGDAERVGRIAGSRSYALKGEAAQLEAALWRFACDALVQRDFALVHMPSLAREAAFIGTGHFPVGREDVYQVEDDLFLSGTAEVGLNYLHSGEILSLSDLPKQYCGFSPCFRREAGAAGRDVRGLIRVHQFYKVEQYVMCRADKQESARWFDALLANAESLLQALELPYRVVKLSTGEMGIGKVRAWDIESWFPSQERYRETHTVSELYDWQARRADLRELVVGAAELERARALQVLELQPDVRACAPAERGRGNQRRDADEAPDALRDLAPRHAAPDIGVE